MLTITAPIKTVLNNDLASDGESFARRIMANYDQLNEFITREDLFHVVTQPPEIFLMDGGGSSFMSETEIHNTQLKKVEIINNLMNRILVSADGNLTYQDEVYITNVLHKLGIRDERTFMKKVYELTAETRENNRLIETYWQNLTALSQMVADYKTTINEGDVGATTELSEEVLHLHEDVFKRWMTAAVYRMENNFRVSSDTVTHIGGDSYRMTEEQRLSQQILLQRLREQVRGEAVPLIYRHDNYYETPPEGVEDMSKEAVAQQIASAVLLNLVDNLYGNLTYRNITIGDRYYRTEDAFYRAGEHVFERMEGNTSYLISEHRAGDMTTRSTELSRNEISLIGEIIENYQPVIDTTVSETSGGYEGIPEELIHPEAAAEPSAEEPGEVTVEERREIEQTLRQTNLINERRQAIYMQNLQNLSRSISRIREDVPDMEERRREIAYAFEHPDEYRAEFESEGRAESETKSRAVEEFIEALPRHSRDAMKLIETYIREPMKFYGTQIITQNAETLLYRETIEAAREEHMRRESERVTEVINQTTQNEKTVTDRMQRVEENVGRITPETIRLVHKVSDTVVDEQTIEELRRQINRIENDTTKLQTVVDNKENVVEKQVNNYNETIINETNAERITMMIQDKINSQIGNITGKVYNRLEKQLMSERRRRGM